MSSRVYHDYIVRDRQTGEVLCEGSCGKCSDFLGCTRTELQQLSGKVRSHVRSTNSGFFNSRYEVTRAPEKTRGRKYYRVYRNDQLVAEGSSYDCAARLGLNMNKWYQLVCKCSMGNDPEYVITAELK